MEIKLTLQETVENLNLSLSGNKMSTEELYQWERTVGEIFIGYFDAVPYFTTDDTGKVTL